MIKLLHLKHLFILLLIVFIAANSFGQTDKAETDIQAIMKQFDAVGLSVAVVKKGEII
jgi:CubicO group peptidase (beta-lactamase class C family)